MTDTRSRFAIDLDEIERQLQQGASAPPAPSRSDPSRGDPLAELARIVGQNDPFRDLLAAESVGRASASPDTRHAYPEPEPPRAQAAHAPAFDDHFAHQAYADPTGGHPAYAEAHHHASEADGHETYAPAPARRSRRGLMLAGAAVGALVLGVGGFAATKLGRTGPTGGEPPVVKADAGPVKVQPQNPGGVEIPNQNRQIYEKGGAPDGQTKVVNREEQPVDVRQAAKAMQPAALPPPSSPLTAAPTTASIVPAAPPVGATAALGEPRRVRTVSVRPDGSIAAAEQTGSAKAPTTMPTAVTGGPTSTASTPAAQPKPKPPVTVPPVTAQSATPAAPVRTPAAEAPPAAKTPQRLASVEPPATTPEAAAPTGGFSVQLAVRPSEKEARSAFQQFQQRFPDDLGSKPALIRKAEVNGSTIYRVRVGPLGKDDANSLCTRLQSAGGQCFVAKN